MLTRTPLALAQSLTARGLDGVLDLGSSVAARLLPRRDAAPPSVTVVPTCQTIDQVIARMTRLGETFEQQPAGANDGLACFNRLYRSVTEGVRAKVETAGYFDDPEMIAELDILFAQLYFDAVDGHDSPAEVPGPWRALIQARENRDILPLQFAIAGINAHIDHDLPIALLAQWDRHHRRPPSHGVAYDDFELVNPILKDEELLLKSSLEPKLLQAVDKGPLASADDAFGLRIVEDARARAWETAQQLWPVRHDGRLGERLERVSLAADAIARIVLQPL